MKFQKVTVVAVVVFLWGVAANELSETDVDKSAADLFPAAGESPVPEPVKKKGPTYQIKPPGEDGQPLPETQVAKTKPPTKSQKHWKQESELPPGVEKESSDQPNKTSAPKPKPSKKVLDHKAPKATGGLSKYLVKPKKKKESQLEPKASPEQKPKKSKLKIKLPKFIKKKPKAAPSPAPAHHPPQPKTPQEAQASWMSQLQSAPGGEVRDLQTISEEDKKNRKHQGEEKHSPDDLWQDKVRSLPKPTPKNMHTTTPTTEEPTLDELDSNSRPTHAANTQGVGETDDPEEGSRVKARSMKAQQRRRLNEAKRPKKLPVSRTKKRRRAKSKGIHSQEAPEKTDKKGRFTKKPPRKLKPTAPPAPVTVETTTTPKPQGTNPPRGPAQWSEWSGWSPCNKLCKRYRSRQCIGVPSPDGYECAGPFVISQTCDIYVCMHLAGANESTVPKRPEPRGVTFHHNGFLMYPSARHKMHAINMLLRFKPSFPTATLIDRFPSQACRSKYCKNAVTLQMTKQKLTLDVVIARERTRLSTKTKLRLGGWHTVIISVLPTRVSMSLDHQAPVSIVRRVPPPPVDLNLPMKLGFMEKKLVNMKDMIKPIVMGTIAEFRFNYKAASLQPNVKWHGPRPLYGLRTSHYRKETNAVYPPFAGEQFVSYPVLGVATNETHTFQITFLPRFDANGPANPEILFFLPGSVDHSYVFVTTARRKFHFCVKAERDAPILCSKSHAMKTDECNLAVQVSPSRVTVRWKKDASGKVLEQSVLISGRGNSSWVPSNIFFLGGLSNQLWEIVKEEKRTSTLIGFTGYIYSIKVNGKLVSLRKGTVFSKDGQINAWGSTVADNYTEVSNAEGVKVKLMCNYSQNVLPTDHVSVTWLSGSTILQPGVTDQINASIVHRPKERYSLLYLQLMISNHSWNWRTCVDGFYACMLTKNEQRFIVQAYAVTNTSSIDRSLLLQETTAWNMRVPSWMLALSNHTGISTKWLITITIMFMFMTVLLALCVTTLYLYQNDPIFKEHVQESCFHKTESWKRFHKPPPKGPPQARVIHRLEDPLQKQPKQKFWKRFTGRKKKKNKGKPPQPAPAQTQFSQSHHTNRSHQSRHYQQQTQQGGQPSQAGPQGPQSAQRGLPQVSQGQPQRGPFEGPLQGSPRGPFQGPPQGQLTGSPQGQLQGSPGTPIEGTPRGQAGSSHHRSWSDVSGGNLDGLLTDTDFSGESGTGSYYSGSDSGSYSGSWSSRSGTGTRSRSRSASSYSEFAGSGYEDESQRYSQHHRDRKKRRSRSRSAGSRFSRRSARTGAGSVHAGAGMHQAAAGMHQAGAGMHQAGAGMHQAGAGMHQAGASQAGNTQQQQQQQLTGGSFPLSTGTSASTARQDGSQMRTTTDTNSSSTRETSETTSSATTGFGTSGSTSTSSAVPAPLRASPPMRPTTPGPEQTTTRNDPLKTPQPTGPVRVTPVAPPGQRQATSVNIPANKQITVTPTPQATSTPKSTTPATGPSPAAPVTPNSNTNATVIKSATSVVAQTPTSTRPVAPATSGVRAPAPVTNTRVAAPGATQVTATPTTNVQQPRAATPQQQQPVRAAPSAQRAPAPAVSTPAMSRPAGPPAAAPRPQAPAPSAQRAPAPVASAQRVLAPVASTQRASAPVATVQRAPAPVAPVQRAPAPVASAQRVQVATPPAQRAPATTPPVQRVQTTAPPAQRAPAPAATTQRTTAQPMATPTTTTTPAPKRFITTASITPSPEPLEINITRGGALSPRRAGGDQSQNSWNNVNQSRLADSSMGGPGSSVDSDFYTEKSQSISIAEQNPWDVPFSPGDSSWLDGRILPGGAGPPPPPPLPPGGFMQLTPHSSYYTQESDSNMSLNYMDQYGFGFGGRGSSMSLADSSVSQQVYHTPSSQGLSSASWFNTNENARPQGLEDEEEYFQARFNTNENARPQGLEDEEEYFQAPDLQDERYPQARSLEAERYPQARSLGAERYPQARGLEDEEYRQARSLEDERLRQARREVQHMQDSATQDTSELEQSTEDSSEGDSIEVVENEDDAEEEEQVSGTEAEAWSSGDSVYATPGALRLMPCIPEESTLSPEDPSGRPADSSSLLLPFPYRFDDTGTPTRQQQTSVMSVSLSEEEYSD